MVLSERLFVLKLKVMFALENILDILDTSTSFEMRKSSSC